VTIVNGQRTAVEAKFVEDWGSSLRNPASPVKKRGLIYLSGFSRLSVLTRVIGRGWRRRFNLMKRRP
jgi:hypothetical protein